MAENKKKTGADDLKMALTAAEICDNNKGRNIVLYDLKQTSMLADYYLVCSGTSEPHLRALAGYIEKGMLKHNRRSRHIDGSPTSRWVVIDYGNLMIHLFLPAMRQYYEIEKLWQESAEILYTGGDDKDSEPVPIF